ncbi:hypothetical protein RGF97_18935 [Streptomyces roseicoloratus]|uniref:Uncharacterized protein n=1 Tax=Streptomyces roseicoloratus TaxID=2508722 RepID=A0ABY9RX19_9ACTN|nr:hypothetical protein [Streptomyces roseicoloratus]WMX46502.1 hypothetical protein RGF97_18935 [Streptomyces roseicoloratus]
MPGDRHGTLPHVHHGVDVVALVPAGKFVEAQDEVGVAAEVDGNGGALGGQADEGQPLLGEAHGTVRIDEAAKVVGTGERHPWWGDPPRFAAVGQAELVESGPGLQGAQSPDRGVADGREVRRPGAFGDGAVVRGQSPELLEDRDVSGVDLDSQLTFASRAGREVSVGLKEAEHVGVVRVLQVHEGRCGGGLGECAEVEERGRARVGFSHGKVPS